MKIKYFFWIAFIACIVDFFTAIQVLGAESNPLYVITGSLWPLIAIKLIFLSCFYFWYTKPKTEHNYYYFCMTVMFAMILFSFGSYTNIRAMLNPSIVEIGSQIASEVKIQYYVNVMSILGFIPMILCLGSFELFYRTRKERLFYNGRLIQKEERK